MAQQDVQAKDQSEGQPVSTAKPGSMAQRSSAVPFGFFMTPNELLRMNPFALMRRMMEDVLLGDTTARGDPAIAWSPAIEVSAQNGRYIVRVELPGLKPEDIKVEVKEGALVVQGERKSVEEEDQNGVHRTERHYGRFYRTVPLPDGADVDQARATFQDGVLEVSVPVATQENKRREIAIEASAPSDVSAAVSDKAA